MDPFDPYSPFKLLIFYYSSLLTFYRVFKHYNNHSGAYIAGTRNSTGAYIVIMASLQALVNSLLVWQSSCENKLRVNSFQTLVDVQLIIRTSISGWRVNRSGVREPVRETMVSVINF